MEDPLSSGGWRFAQCFGDKGDIEDITEGASCRRYRPPVLLWSGVVIVCVLIIATRSS